ncbi:MAG: YesL family protein [Clostridia bacterium]|nr:YesL family protein [Clostridia bacterium]
MGSLFNFNKEGKGVTKEDVAAETPLKRFFVEFVHRFWQLILLNLLYVVACIPIITVGPATAAMNYVCRNFSQAKPVFFFPDFIEKCKEHFKQGLAVWMIQLLTGGLLVFAFLGWTDSAFQVSGGLRTAAVVVILVFAYLLICSSFYIYPMMVSFDLTVKQLIRNSVILAMTQLWRNLVILVVLGILVVVSFLFWPLTFPVLLFLAFTLMAYVSNSLVFPVLKRLVATPSDASESSDQSAE